MAKDKNNEETTNQEEVTEEKLEAATQEPKEIPKEKTIEKRRAKFGYMFVAPMFLVFIVFSIYPILYTLYLSFTDFGGFADPQWIGLDNYTRVWNDSNFRVSLVNTIRIWGINIVVQVGLAFLLIMIFSDLQYRFRGVKFFRILFYLPNLIAAASVALIFRLMLNRDYGILNMILIRLNLTTSSIGWLEDTMLAQISVANIQTWMWFGNSFILFMAAVQAVNKEVIESAVIDGAGRFQLMRHVKLPLIKPILIYVGVTSLIGGLQLFDVPYLITDGRGAPSRSLNTVIVYLFNHAFHYHNFGYAAAIAFVLFLIVMFVSAIFVLMMKREDIREYLKKRKAAKA